MALTTGESGAPASLLEQLRHTCRVRSVKGMGVALFSAVASRVAPSWWVNTAPWHVGRLLESFHRKVVALDRARFVGPDNFNQTSFMGLLWLVRYEVLERHAISKWVRADSEVIELGASIGVVACLLNRRLANPSRHVCVEANPALIEILQSNRDRNGCRFHSVHAALAYGAPSVSFGVSSSIVDSALGSATAENRVVVPAVSLRQLLDDAGFVSSALVCDIEGAEQALAEHEGGVLRDRIHTAVLEVHPQYLGDEGIGSLRDRFASAGFTLVSSRSNIWVLLNRQLNSVYRSHGSHE
jgi:FkbM family methyltransferase